MSKISDIIKQIKTKDVNTLAESSKALLDSYKELKNEKEDLEVDLEKAERNLERLKEDYDEILEELDNVRDKERNTLKEYELLKHAQITNDGKLLSKDVEIEVLKEENQHLKRVIGELRELPDLHNMIKNLESLTTPNLDKLTEMLNNSNLEKFEDFNKQLEGLKKEIRDTIRAGVDSVIYGSKIGGRF